MHVDASDSDGVKGIEVENDAGVEGDSDDSPCAGTTCTLDYTFDTNPHPGGTYVIRVNVTDNAGNVSSRSFIVHAPTWAASADPPEPPPESDAARQQREAMLRSALGLQADATYVSDVDQDPVAREAADEYSIALTPTELTDMNARSAAQNAIADIQDYLHSSAVVGDYAGMWIDQQNGGLIEVGFTHNAAAHLAELQAIYPYPTRLRTFAATLTMDQLDALHDRIDADIDGLVTQGFDIRSVRTSYRDNKVEIGVPNPTPSQTAQIQAAYGSGAALITDATTVTAAANRFKAYTHIYPGLRIHDSFDNVIRCTAGLQRAAHAQFRSRPIFRNDRWTLRPSGLV